MADLKSIQRREFDPKLPLANIERDEFNVRTESIRSGLEELKASIKNVGLIHPIVVTRVSQNKYSLIVGQRRFLSFQELGEKTIPAIIINDVDDVTKRLISFAENINRRQLPYNDTIKVCDELYNAYSKYPKSKRLEKISQEVGISIETVMKYLSYRIVPEPVRQLVEQKKLDRSQAFKLTETFWPNTSKITKIANYMVGMTKPEWENILDAGEELPMKATADEVIIESKKPSRKVPVTIRMSRTAFDKLKSIASQNEAKRDISDFINDIIEDFLKAQ